MLSRKVISWSIRLLLALLIGLTSVAFLPSPADAAEIDLELGGAGATSWNITCIAPGDNGTETVYLQNIGTRNGFVTIWISNITEVDKDYGVNDPNATLDTHLLFNITCGRLSTTITLPRTIYHLPQDASDKSLKITPLNAGDNVTLVWEWQFPETGEQQNDAQGDSLSFTINYMLEEFHGRGPGGGGGGGGTSYQWLLVDVLGNVTKVKVDSSGKLLESANASDAQGQMTLQLDYGTQVLCVDNKVPQKLEVKVAESPTAPRAAQVLDEVYEVSAYLKGKTSPSPFVISPAGRLVLRYHLGDLPEYTSLVYIACYDAEQGWMQLGLADVAMVGELTPEVSQPMVFAIMVQVTAPPASRFRVTDLVIGPIKARPNDEITINVTVTNIGDTPGDCTLQLRIDGQDRGTKEISLNPGESTVVSFTITESLKGMHVVEIADLEGNFRIVVVYRPWWLSSMAAGGLVIYLERRRRWQQKVNWGTGLKTKDWIIK